MRDILFLAHRVPYPPDRGDKIRSYQVLRYLAARARVHLVAFADDPADCQAHPHLRELIASCTIVPRRKGRVRATLEALASGLPVSLTAFDHPAMHAAMAAAPRTDATYCFSGQMAQYLPARTPAVMDFCDVDSAKFAQQAATAALPLRPLLRREARLLGRFECAVAARVTASLFVTASEAALFRSTGGSGRIEVVENGIDARFFDPAASFETVDRAGQLIVFTGQMDYQPNVDAVTLFAREVLPAVRARRPAARFAIVGRAPTPAVHALAKLPGVLVTGAVPDVRGWLAAAQVCVAPLQLARGIQNKVLEAMAMARPVIASPGAAEGIDHAGTIAVADGAEDWIEQVCAALDGAGQGGAARAQVIARYDWRARLQPLDALLGLPAERVAA
ncbi:MAG: glycosyl transferase family 1 [Sphingomonas bacterium]|uniref:TIGR03087 family PEP-CTERM/XrtA system glycosyltransferase n=1 Tax=Sphingomonas bacterium TaxID=1895847 RepID=UPI002610E525|nr:TIGR03087 family PEP-CTERM/XrtA system glycosyltransferase [Sphingomonas bacterium]MDB5695428.1 glycosyl transferase family 1 [Sphingomonas bacterium]